jgi:hypothetical protein
MHLTRYDSTHGRFTGMADLEQANLVLQAKDSTVLLPYSFIAAIKA